MGKKIEIDLDDILGGEDSQETLQESVKRQVVENISRTMKEGVGKAIDQEIAKVLNDEMKKAIQVQMPDIINDLLNAEYYPVSQYGNRGDKTTFRKELIKSLSQELVYKKTNYSSDRNKFTETVDSVVGENLELFKAAFKKEIDAKFTAEALNFAAEALRKRLNIER